MGKKKNIVVTRADVDKQFVYYIDLTENFQVTCLVKNLVASSVATRVCL